jgi:peptidyl-prolyl cis-trans isomerase C
MITVNQQPISEAEIFAEMQYHPAASKRQAMVDAAQSLIISTLLQQHAKQRGIVDVDNPDAAVERLLAEDIRAPEASTQECHSYYLQNLVKFCSSPLLEVRHLLLGCAPDDAQGRIDALDQATLLLKQLQHGQSFAALCQQFSACSTKDSGGLLGQISKGQTVPELERIMMKLPVGLHPQPLESRYGVHIVELLHRVEGQQLPFEAVQQRIADYLNEKVRRKATAQYIQQLVAAASIEGFDFQISASPLMQ